MRSFVIGRAGVAALLSGVFAFASAVAGEFPFADTVSLADRPTRWVAGAPIVALGNPTDIVLSPDGKRAYLVNGSGCTIEVLDLATGALVGPPIVVGLKPWTLAITPDGRRGLVPNFSDFNVQEIDLEANAVVGDPITLRSIQVDKAGATDLAITPDGKRAVVTVSQGRLVCVIDLATHLITSRMKLRDGGPASVAISRDGARAIVLTEGFRALWTIDLARNLVVGDPLKLTSGPGDVAVSPDGKLAYMLCSKPGSNTIVVYDLEANAVSGTPILAGGGNCDCPNSSIAITPDGKRAYVTNRGNIHRDNEGAFVGVFDLVERKMTGSIQAGATPSSIAIAPDGSRAYVLNTGDGTMSTIDLATNKVTGAPLTVGFSPSDDQRQRLLSAQLRSLEAAVDSLYPVERIGPFILSRSGGPRADYIASELADLRGIVEEPRPEGTKFLSRYDTTRLANSALDLRWRVRELVAGPQSPAPRDTTGLFGMGRRLSEMLNVREAQLSRDGQPLIDLLSAVAIELGFW